MIEIRNISERTKKGVHILRSQRIWSLQNFPFHLGTVMSCYKNSYKSNIKSSTILYNHLLLGQSFLIHHVLKSSNKIYHPPPPLHKCLINLKDSFNVLFPITWHDKLSKLKYLLGQKNVGLIFRRTKLFVGQNFVTSKKFRHFCPTKNFVR